MTAKENVFPDELIAKFNKGDIMEDVARAGDAAGETARQLKELLTGLQDSDAPAVIDGFKAKRAQQVAALTAKAGAAPPPSPEGTTKTTEQSVALSLYNQKCEPPTGKMKSLAAKLGMEPLPEDANVHDYDVALKARIGTKVAVKTLVRLADYNVPIKLIRTMRSGEAYSLLKCVECDSTKVRANVFDEEEVYDHVVEGLGTAAPSPEPNSNKRGRR